jgi:hypothetical protein
VAALFATRREDLTAVLGAHALEETVDALASAVVRLKGPFHGTGCSKLRVKPKALYCIGMRSVESREIAGLRMVLKLSTPVDKPVDNPLQERGPKPCSAAVPAA